MAPKVWVSAHSREEGPTSLSRKSTGQGEGRLTHGSTPQGLEAVLEGGGRVGNQKPLGSELLCAPGWGIVSETSACVGRRHPSCLPHSYSEARAQA